MKQEDENNIVEKEIKTLIDVLQLFKRQMRTRARQLGNEECADRYDDIMDTLAMPLFYTWESFNMGKLEEIMYDWELYLPYQNFKTNIKSYLEELIDGLKENENLPDDQNIFAGMERDGKVTKALLVIYQNLLLAIRSSTEEQ